MSGTAPDTPSPEEAAPPPPRKLTAARLLGALRKDPRFREAMPFHDVVPYGAEAVLKALCGLVAASPELGVYRLPPVLGTRICEVLGVAMKKVGAEAAIAEDLDALCAAGLVLSEDFALSLPLDFAALTAPLPRAYSEDELRAMTPSQRASVVNGKKGGRPRKVVEGQREMAVHQVVAGTSFPASRTETRQAGQVSDGGNPAPQPGFDPRLSPGFLAEAAAADEEVIFESDLHQQQQLGARAAENPAGNLAENLTGNLGGNLGEKPGADAEATSYDDETVRRTLGLIALAAGLAPRQLQPDDVGLVRAWLGLNLTPERIVETVRLRVEEKRRQKEAGRGGRPIGSVSYFDARVREVAGAPARDRGGVPEPAAAGSTSLRELHRPWMDSTVLFQVGVVVRAVDAGDLDTAAAAFLRLQRISGRAAGLVRQKYPDLAPATEEEPMRAAG